MSPVQTTYTDQFASQVAGALARVHQSYSTRMESNATAGLKPGEAVVYDSGTDTIARPADVGAAADAIAVVTYYYDAPNSALNEVVEFDADTMVPVVDDGLIYVTLKGPVNKFDKVVYDPALEGWVAGATNTTQFIADSGGATDDVIAVRVQP